MTMTTEAEEVKISLAGTGTAKIYWGDGSNDIDTIDDDCKDFNHTYKSASIHTVTVSGYDITLLHCNDNQLTGLDVSNNTALELLHCGSNQLTDLDVRNRP